MDIRAILDRNRIEWRDHGANTSKNNVNVNCPWCGESRFHMAISEDGEGYYCFRNSRHSGKNLNHLFRKLGIKEKFAFSDIPESAQQPRRVIEKDYGEFRFFSPAQESEEALTYLKTRGFEYPDEAAKQFNLKVAPIGKWAGRLIIPMTVGWTGRAMRPHLDPRYLAHTDDSGLFIYGKGTSVIVMEGQIDAMRIAACINNIVVVSTGGQKIPASLILFLRERKFHSILYLPDADVKQDQWNKNFELVTSYCSSFANVSKIDVPPPAKDPALLSDSQIRDWFLKGDLWNARKLFPSGQTTLGIFGQ